jgi:flagellum-specific ATP synthase
MIAVSDHPSRSDEFVPPSLKLALIRVGGRVCAISPGNAIVRGLSAKAKLGDLVDFGQGDQPVLGEVLKLDSEQTYIRLFGESSDVRVGARAWLADGFQLAPSRQWRGRVFDPFGHSLDGGAPLSRDHLVGVRKKRNIPSMMRQAIVARVTTGISAIDCFTPICFGQRIGIFAGSGVGKSTLLGMLSRCDDFDTVVVALVGERGREVREFIEFAMGDNREKAVTIVATSDESAMVRRLAARSAMTVAEYFRDQGDTVLLILDSITRYAHSLREVAISLGEPPVARGYPPSVFSDIARLLERAGTGANNTGSITGIISVLVDGDDHNDPVADAVRGILDGHIVLERSIAERGRFPAINLLASVSRLAHQVQGQDEKLFVRSIRRLIERFEESADLRAIGAYVAGSDPELDRAIEVVPNIYEAISQSLGDPPERSALLRLREVANSSP